MPQPAKAALLVLAALVGLLLLYGLGVTVVGALSFTAAVGPANAPTSAPPPVPLDAADEALLGAWHAQTPDLLTQRLPDGGEARSVVGTTTIDLLLRPDHGYTEHLRRELTGACPTFIDLSTQGRFQVDAGWLIYEQSGQALRAEASCDRALATRRTTMAGLPPVAVSFRRSDDGGVRVLEQLSPTGVLVRFVALPSSGE